MQDIVYGVTVSGRPTELKKITNTVGVFINSVPTRTVFQAERPILYYLQDGTAWQVARNPYEYLSYADIAAASAVGMNLYDSLFTFENYSIDHIYDDQEAGFHISEEWINETTNYPLNWVVRPGRTVTVSAIYNTGCMNDDMIEIMLACYVSILEQISTDITIKMVDIKVALGKKIIPGCRESDTDQDIRRLIKQLSSAIDKKAKGKSNQIIILSEDPIYRAAAICGAYHAGYVTEVMPEFSYRYHHKLDAAAAILCDDKNATFLAAEYFDKCIDISQCEEKRSFYEAGFTGSAASSEPAEVFFGFISKDGTVHVTFRDIRNSFSFMRDKTVLLDERCRDNKLITNVTINVLWNQDAILTDSGEYGFNILFTEWDCLEDWAHKEQLKECESIYLPYDPIETQIKADVIQRVTERGIRTLSDYDTGLFLYHIIMPEQRIIYKNAMICDAYGNEVPAYFVGRLFAKDTMTASRESRQRDIATGYTGRIKGQYGFELSHERSEIGFISGKRVRLTELRQFLIDNKKVKECLITFEVSTYVFYYTGQSGNSNFLKNLIKTMSAHLKISEAHIKKAVAFCKIERFYYDITGNVLPASVIKQTKNHRFVLTKEGIYRKEPEQSNKGTQQKSSLSAMEKSIAAIWEAVLNKDISGREDNFFDLGGNSLDVMKVISRMNVAFPMRFKIDDIIDHPTLGELGRFIQDKNREEGQDTGNHQIIKGEKPCLSEEEKNNGVQISFSQRRFWFIHQYDNNDYFYNGAEAVKITGAVDVACLEKAITHLTMIHEILRTVFEMRNRVLYQRVLPVIKDYFTVISIKDIVREQNEEESISQFIKKEAMRSFDFERGPLFHCTLLKTAPDRAIFVLVIHHIISDGWSVSIFIDSMMQAYHHFLNGEQELPPPPAWQISEFSVWQHNMFTDQVMEEQILFWKEQLKDWRQLLLPYDFERPPVQSFRGKKYVCQYSGDIVANVYKTAQLLGVTPYIIYLSALNIVLAAYSAQEDVVIGVPVTNRPLREVEENIGCFMNTVVLRNQVRKELSFRELTAQVQKVMVEAYNHQELPFDLLVEKLGIKRDSSINPLFQVLFLFQNVPHPSFEIEGLKIERQNVDNQAAMVDLAVSMEEYGVSGEAESGAAEGGRGIHVFFEYSTDLFMEGTIIKLSEDYRNTVMLLCSEVSADASFRVFDHDLISNMIKVAQAKRSEVRQSREKPEDIAQKKDIPKKIRKPANDTETAIGEIWKKILNRDDIGVKDNFFDLGGTSMILIETYYIIKERFDTKLTPVDLFKYPTIEAISQFIAKQDDGFISAEEIKPTEEVNMQLRRMNQSRLKELHSI